MCLGIDLHQLIYQISSGQRLPDPKFCPPNVSSLMKKCFQEKPQHRPNFEDIKKDIATSYSAVLSLSASNKGESQNEVKLHPSLSITQMTDFHIRHQYLDLINLNETSKKDARDISSDTSKESPKYASLDHLERIGTIESTQQGRTYVNANWNKL